MDATEVDATEVIGSAFTALTFTIINEIRRYGRRIEVALANYKDIIENVEGVLASDDPDRCTWRYTSMEDPTKLLDDLRPWCQLALQLDVPAEVIVKARRGEPVSITELESANAGK